MYVAESIVGPQTWWSFSSWLAFQRASAPLLPGATSTSHASFSMMTGTMGLFSWMAQKSSCNALAEQCHSLSEILLTVYAVLNAMVRHHRRL